MEPRAARGNDTNPTVVFVASTSRSGSTLLDMVLGDNEGYYSVGEMRQLQGFTAQNYELSEIWDREYPLVCTCGRPVEECDFWLAVQEEAGLDFRDVPFKSRANAVTRRLVQVGYMAFGPRVVRWAARLLPPVERELEVASNCFRVYSAISRLTGARHIVDSSKIPYQYMLLRICAPRKVKLIVLYRDGRAVAHSMTRGHRHKEWQDSKRPPFARAVESWIRFDRRIKLFTSRTPAKDKITVRYEDLCAGPDEELRAISSHLGIGPLGGATAVDRSGRHNIGGSPSRFEAPRSEISLDERWKASLTPEQLETFERLGGRLNRRLGYES